MIVKYGPGSLVTRQRSSLAASRLVAPYQVPVVVVTNGKNADILNGFNGNVTASGLEKIPSKPDLEKIIVLVIGSDDIHGGVLQYIGSGFAYITTVMTTPTNVLQLYGDRWMERWSDTPGPNRNPHVPCGSRLWGGFIFSQGLCILPCSRWERVHKT